MEKEARIGVRVPPQIKRKIKQYSVKDGDRSMSSFVRKLLLDGLDLYEESLQTPTEQMKRNGAAPLPLVEA